MPDIKINKTTLSFTNIYYISPNGNDDTGDGSKSNPFQTWYKARDIAASGDAIYFLEGTHTLTYNRSTYNNGYYGYIYFYSEKTLNIFGEPYKTKIVLDGTNHPISDYSRFHGIRLDNCKIYRLTIEIINAHSSSSYMNALFSPQYSNPAEFNNCLFICKSNTGFMYGGGTYTLNNCTIIYMNPASSSAGETKYYNVEALNMSSALSTTTNPTTSIFRSTTISYGDIETYISIKNIPTDCKNIGTGLNIDGTQSHIGIQGNEFGWGSKYIQKFMVKNDNKYKIFTTRWEEPIGSSTPTKDDFINYGLDDINILNSNINTLIEPSFIVMYTDNTNPSFNLNGKPRPIISKLAYMSISDLDHIDSMTINAINTNNSILKILVSPDGNSYYKYNNSIWELIELTKNNIKNQGMTLAEFNSINEGLNTLSSIEPKKLYIAFYLEIDELNTVSVNTIEFQADIKGSWEVCSKFNGNIENYELIYKTNNKLTGNFYIPGIFKINYVLGKAE